MILCIETATSLCSVALCDSRGVVALKENAEGRSHAAMLAPFIHDLLKEADIKASELEAIAVSKGPGSYTSLRIGVSTAKGISYASAVPLIGIDTTYSMFHGFISSKADLKDTDMFCPLIDARRMEVYYSVIRRNGSVYRETKAEVIESRSFADIPASSRIFFFGDGSAKCMNVIDRENVVFDNGFKISAVFMQSPAYEALQAERFENTAYFEPFYLKDFLATRPVKNIL